MRKAIVFLTLFVLAALVVTPTQAQDDTVPKTGFRPDAPPYGVRGPYSVGMMDFKLDNPDRPLPVMVWYPTTGAEATLDYSGYGGFPVTGTAAFDAAPDLSGAPYPLVVNSHGLWGTRDTAQWLPEHLASYGFVVIAPQHVGSSLETYFELMSDPDALPSVVAQTFQAYGQRPQDIVRTLDFADKLTSDSALAGMIDMEHVAVSGASFGGYTALAAGGGQLEMNWLNNWCDAHKDQSIAFELWGVPIMECSAVTHQAEIAAAFGLDKPPDGLWPSAGDPRVDAIIAIAPGLVQTYGDDGLAGITVPALVLGGTQDTVTPAENNAYRAYETLGSASKALVAFADADHFLLTVSNGNDALLDMGLFWADPVWDLDRGHDIADHLITAFLLDVLKGDPDAHAALLAENVSFPGITYETTMK